MVRRLVHGARVLGAFVLVVAWPGAALAAPPAATSRPLTRAELVATTAHEAEAIAVCDFVAQRLTDRDPESLKGGRLPYHVGLRPRRWLKGDLGPAELDVCWWPWPGQGQAFRLDPPRPGGGPARAPFAGDLFVVFLRRPPAAAPDADSCLWFGIEQGVDWLLPAISPWTASFETEVRSALGGQSPEVLASGAQRIVVGTVQLEKADRAGAPGKTSIRVSRTLKGPRDPSRIPVRLVDPRIAAPNERPQLFLLRHVGNGVYEPVGLGAGVLAVQDGRVPAWNVSLDELAKRVGTTAAK